MDFLQEKLFWHAWLHICSFMQWLPIKTAGWRANGRFLPPKTFRTHGSVLIEQHQDGFTWKVPQGKGRH